MPCKVGTIREICQRLVSEGYNVSEYTLRRWVKNEQLPAVYSGKKALISYEKVVKLLDQPSVSPFIA